MSAVKLVSESFFPSITPIIRNSFQWAHRYTSQSELPFIPKGPSILVANLMKSYFEKGLLREARTLFGEIPERDVVAWTAMISGYSSCGHHTQAWMFFCNMTKEGIYPNSYTISSALKACKGMESCSCGAIVHGLALKYGADKCIYVENTLLDMYATCSFSMDNACMVFQQIKLKNDVSWTTMITGYTHRGDAYGGLRVFLQMLQEMKLNPYSCSIAVRACASIGSHSFGKQIHAMVIQHGYESNLPVANSILDMYRRCNSLPEANQYFQEMPQRDVTTWNILIDGFQKSSSCGSLYVFLQMRLEGLIPNCFTFTSVVAACANLAVLNCGQQVHGGIVQSGFEENVALANSLVDMYAKCGSIADSRKVFNEMPCRNLVSWTSMMIGYGSHGHGREAVRLFNEMVNSGIKPDRIAFMAVLSACSHAGLVEEGLKYFNSMVIDYNVNPNQEIYGCVVDLLGRAGRVMEAYELMGAMPFEPDESVWGALLGACKAHKSPNLGRLTVQKILDMRPNWAGTYVTLSNIYATDGKWVEFAKMRKLIRGLEKRKEAGRSWIEVRNQVHSFIVGDKVGSNIKLVYEGLEMLLWNMKEAGYVPDLDCLLHDLEDGT